MKKPVPFGKTRRLLLVTRRLLDETLRLFARTRYIAEKTTDLHYQHFLHLPSGGVGVGSVGSVGCFL